MADASRDDNYTPTKLGVSSTDGVTPIRITADPVSHQMMVDDSSLGVGFPGATAARDENYVVTIMAVSEADGVTPVELYVDIATGNILLDSN